MSKLITEARTFCESILKNSKCANYHFHNLKHTLEVYENVHLISDAENLSAEEIEILAISALFHDTGYSKIYVGHEEISMHIADEFLTQKMCNRDYISSVLKCIAATRMPQYPENILEKIICDADLAHLSASNYPQRIALLRKEWNCFLNKNYFDEEWQSLNIEFLRNHKYHTNFGSARLESFKMKNLLILEQQLVTKN